MLPTIYASTAAGFAMVQVTRENLRATQVIVKRVEAIRLGRITAAAITQLVTAAITPADTAVHIAVDTMRTRRQGITTGTILNP